MVKRTFARCISFCSLSPTLLNKVPNKRQIKHPLIKTANLYRLYLCAHITVWKLMRPWSNLNPFPCPLECQRASRTFGSANLGFQAASRDPGEISDCRETIQHQGGQYTRGCSGHNELVWTLESALIVLFWVPSRKADQILIMKYNAWEFPLMFLVNVKPSQNGPSLPQCKKIQQFSNCPLTLWGQKRLLVQFIGAKLIWASAYLFQVALSYKLAKSRGLINIFTESRYLHKWNK